MPCREAGRRKKEKPRSAELAGVDGGHKAHAIGLRNRRDQRLTVRWKQVIASSFYRDWLPGWVSDKSNNCRLTPGNRADKPNFSIAITELIGVFFAISTPHPAVKRIQQSEP